MPRQHCVTLQQHVVFVVFGNTVCSLVSSHVVFVVCGSPAFSLKYCMLIGSVAM